MVILFGIDVNTGIGCVYQLSGRDEQPDFVMKYCDCSPYPQWYLQDKNGVTLIRISSLEHIKRCYWTYGLNINLNIIHVRERRWLRMDMDELFSYIKIIKCFKCGEIVPFSRMEVYLNYVRKHWVTRTTGRF